MDETGYMRRALELAHLAEGAVSPRPPVGAVVVDTLGRVAGEGFTRRRPGPHAEAAALAAAGTRARGGTCYVTLEPCPRSSVGPACADELVRAGVARVVVGTTDPHPDVDGRGLDRLRQAGVAVEVGVLEPEARRLVAPFAKWARTGLPFVTLKLAATLDGKVAAPDGTSRWITGERARAEVHELRRRADAVLVGSGTVCADDPALTIRLPGWSGRQPVRVVLDSSGRTPPGARIFDATAPSLVVAAEAGDWPGIEVVRVSRAEGGVDVREALEVLGARGIYHVLCEGGPGVAASLLSRHLVDHLVVYLAPKIVGGDAPGMFGSGVKTLEEAWGLEITDVRRVGEDVRIDARLR